MRRSRTVEEVGDCRILFIDRAESQQLEHIGELLRNRGTLTVSDMEGAGRRGVMIQLATDNNRIKLLINVDSARAAGLTISSKLLRPADIVQSDRD